MEEIKVHSTKDQLEDFKESIVWSDMRRELKTWKHGFNMEMLSIVDNAETENPSTASILLHMGDLNGRQKAVDYILGIIDMFLSMKEEKQDNKPNRRRLAK